MSNKYHNNENGDKRKLSLEPPSGIVPENIRTSSTIPRILAVCIICVWIVVFTVGTQTLAERQRKDAWTEQTVVSLGTTWHGVKMSSGGEQCIGYFQTVLDNHENLKLNTTGALQLRVGNSNQLIKLSFVAKFNQYFKLGKFEGTARLLNVELTARANESSHTLNIIATTNGKTHHESLPFPYPIFLLQHKPNEFTLRLPPSFTNMISQFHGSNTDLASAFGFIIEELPKKQAHLCRSEVLNLTQNNDSQIFNAGKYLKLLGIPIEIPQNKHSGTSTTTFNQTR